MKEHGLKHFRILVAYDDSSILDLFQQVLSRAETDQTVHPEVEVLKFDIETCQQGDEAVDAVKSSLKEGRPFSAAFIDIRMPPGPDGTRASEHIRALDSDIEIVIVTGYSDTHPRGHWTHTQHGGVEGIYPPLRNVICP